MPGINDQITAAATDVPLFLGYTELGDGASSGKSVLIQSYDEFSRLFGNPGQVQVILVLNPDNSLSDIVVPQPKFLLAYSVRAFFANGGRQCYVHSTGNFDDGKLPAEIKLSHFNQAIGVSEGEVNITLIVIPDLHLLIDAPFSGGLTFDWYNQFLQSLVSTCNRLKNRFIILDVWHPYHVTQKQKSSYIQQFRLSIGNDQPGLAAAYYPRLVSKYNPYVDETSANSLKIIGGSDIPDEIVLRGNDPLTSLFHINKNLYSRVMRAIRSTEVVLPPSGAVAGIYGSVDSSIGVWKAPVSIPLKDIKALSVNITEEEQQSLNVDPEGKSINAIRSFTGKGVLVWGARTLTGNDNEWRYVPVRRFSMMIERSIDGYLQNAVFEPNDANTWSLIKTRIYEFLDRFWKSGALQGTRPQDAFFIRVGLGETMTQDDINQGRLIVEIGMAAIKPAEFIIIRFMTKTEDDDD